NLNITEILGRADQGVTRPFICRCNDNNTYFVKGLDSTRESQVKEWVAGKLALILELPIAPFSLVYADPELARLPEYNGLGNGLSFGSKKKQVTELSYSDLGDVPTDLQVCVLAFDWWIQNWDRTLTVSGGNPNLFWSPEVKELVVIDHNQAFDPSFSEKDFMNYHVFKDKIPLLFDDMMRREEFSTRFINALDNWNDICSQIPEAWFYLDDAMTVRSSVNLGQMKSIVNRINSPGFWKLAGSNE
ncbi:hypothetical protein A3758_26590, partial [Oleiphilus sp. HI0118]